MSRASFANIDKYTNKVAVAIQEAREIVLTANCIAAGMSYCLPQPFTYHPASYETTNRAWVHDTVVQYYKSVDASACSASETSQAFLTYLTDKQTQCPANNLYLFEMIFVIIRFYITQVALLLSSVVSVIIKLIATAFSAGSDGDIKQQLLKEWKFLSSKFKQLFSTGSDLLVNMLMNSGVLGKSLMQFIQSTCSYVNEAIVWFVDMWCVYIQKYLITFMELLRKFFGYVEGSMRAVSEFIEFLLKYYLPIALLQRYASSAIQTYMVDKYSEPSDKSDRNKNQKVVNKQPMSRLTALKQAQGASKIAGNLPLKNIGFAIGLATVLEVSNYAMDSLAESQRGGIVDQVWGNTKNFFDFQFIRDASDNIVYFLTNDEKCTAYLFYKEHTNKTELLKCPAFSIDPIDPKSTAKSIAPTLCWASSNPSLGESSMYSCTASSTCCPASGCSSSKANNVLCNDCPYPSNTEVSRYACDNQVCKCSVPIQKTSLCPSNEYCDSSSYCDLISMISSVSFGSLPCKDCPGKIMCISDSTTGRCGCIMDKTVNMAACFENPGVFTYPNPTHLCGYMPRLTSTSSQTTFQYRDLMGILCSKSLRTICAVVIMDDGASTFMPVSYAIRQSQNSRRRLLLSSDDDFELITPSVFSYENDYDNLDYGNVHYIMNLPNWNLSSAPCSFLAIAYQKKQKLSILEEHELHKCAYWRHVGRTVIKEYNLTSLIHLETFLVSLDDMSAALTHKNVLWDLLATPNVIARILLMHPWMKPIRAFLIVAVKLFDGFIKEEHVLPDDDHMLKFMKVHAQQVLQNQSTVTSNNITKKVKMIQNYFNNKTKSKKNKNNKKEDVLTVFFKAINNITTRPPPKDNNNHNRKLFSSISEIEAVKQYSADIISGKINPPLSLTAAQSWLRGPYSWPPKYEYSIATCPIIIVTKDSAIEIFSVLSLYFKHMLDDKPPISKSLRNNLPQFLFHPAANQTNILYNYKSWASWIYYNTLNFFKVDPGDIKEFLVGNDKWSLLWILQTSVMCDFGSAMSCSRHNKDLFMSIIVFILFYFIIKFMANALGAPILSTMFFFSFPFFILWYTYGFSPNCLPMLPTCLFTDIIDLITVLFPTQFEFPHLLYCTQTNINYTVTEYSCLQSCSTVGFTEAIDPLAYSVCSFDHAICTDLVKVTNNSVFGPISRSLNKWNQRTTPEQQQAYSFCTWIQWIESLPFIFFALLFTFVMSTTVYALIALIPIFVNLAAQIIAFNHTH
jgi:hypothetical protein